jgi:peptide/nickel transport system substrate-binding protein
MSRAGSPKRTLAALAVLGVFAGLAYWVIQGGRVAPHAAPRATEGRPRPQGDFWVSNVDRPTHLNPFTTIHNVVTRMVLRFTNDALLDLDPKDGTLRDALAVLVARSPDGLEAELALRAGVTFSDGTPVTLDDVRFTLEVVGNKGVPAGSIHDALCGVAALDALPGGGFKIRLAEPYFAGIEEAATEWRVYSKRWFLARIERRARQLGEPMPREGTPRFGEILAQLQLPGPGTGPYRVRVDAEADSALAASEEALVLERNPASWRPRAYPECWNLDGMKLTFADPSAQLALLQQQRVDWWFVDPARYLSDHPELASSYEPVVFDSYSNGNLIVAWCCKKDGLAPPAVRRGLTECFDRKFLVEQILEGQAYEAVSWFRRGSKAYPRDATPLPFSPADARAAFAAAAAAGAPRLDRLVIGYVGETNRRLLERAVPSFRVAGVELVVQPVPAFGTLVERLASGELDGAVLVASHSPQVDPYFWFHSSQRDGHGKNHMGYSSAEADAALVAARTERDETRRLAHWRRFHEIFVRDQPVTLLAHPRTALLVHKRFSGVEPGFLGLVPERWWVEPERRLYDDRGVRR